MHSRKRRLRGLRLAASCALAAREQQPGRQVAAARVQQNPRFASRRAGTAGRSSAVGGEALQRVGARHAELERPRAAVTPRRPAPRSGRRLPSMSVLRPPTRARPARCTGCHGADLSGGSSGVACGRCHDRNLPAGVASWSVNCVMCHGGLENATGAPPKARWGSEADAIRIGAHTAHVVATISAPIGCATCHPVPADALSPGHLGDGTADVSSPASPSPAAPDRPGMRARARAGRRTATEPRSAPPSRGRAVPRRAGRVTEILPRTEPGTRRATGSGRTIACASSAIRTRPARTRPAARRSRTGCAPWTGR